LRAASWAARRFGAVCELLEKMLTQVPSPRYGDGWASVRAEAAATSAAATARRQAAARIG